MAITTPKSRPAALTEERLVLVGSAGTLLLVALGALVANLHFL